MIQDNLLSIFDPMDVELPEQQPDQFQAQEILEAKLNRILEHEGEALLEASDFIGYQVDRIRKANANADICKQTIKQAQTNKKGWERETDFRRWAIQQSLEYLKAKGLLDKPQLTGPDYKVSVSQRQGGLEVSEDMQDFLNSLAEAFADHIGKFAESFLDRPAYLIEDPDFQKLKELSDKIGITSDFMKYITLSVSVCLDKQTVKRDLKLLGDVAEEFSISKNPSLTARI